MFPALRGKSSTFRSAGAMRNLLEVVLSINISSLRDEEAAPGKLCQKNRKLRICYAENAKNPPSSEILKRMKLTSLLLLLFVFPGAVRAQQNLTQYVDPFIGTG